MDISIIIPVYNVEKYIRECIDSIISQTKTKGVECIFVDDCGTDNSLEIISDFIDNYDGEISFKVVNHECNRGLSAARNSGIDNSSGDYLCFIDSDDKLYDENSLSSLWQQVEKHKGVDLVQGNSFIEELNDFDVKKDRFPEYTSVVNWISYAFASLKNPESPWNKMVKRSLLITNNIYFEEGWIQEDTLWSYNLHNYVKSVAYSFEPTYFYRYNASGIMRISGKEKEADAFIKIFNKVYTELLDKKISSGDIRFLEIIASRVYRAIGTSGLTRLLPQKNFFFRQLFCLISCKYQHYSNIVIKGSCFILIYAIRLILQIKPVFKQGCK